MSAQGFLNQPSVRNKYDNHNCLEIGDKAENLFKTVAHKYGYQAISSTKEDNINSHIDIWITKYGRTTGVDVKASKRISRSDTSQQDNLIWIELHSVRPNNKGWLYDGHAQFIAFEQTSSFVIIPRQKLIELIPIHTQKIFVTQAHKAQGHIYQRPGRCDMLTLLDIKHILPFSTVWDK